MKNVLNAISIGSVDCQGKCNGGVAFEPKKINAYNNRTFETKKFGGKQKPEILSVCVFCHSKCNTYSEALHLLWRKSVISRVVRLIFSGGMGCNPSLSKKSCGRTAYAMS